MKKVLGISLVVFLTVFPVVTRANENDGLRNPNLTKFNAGSVEFGAIPHLATTSYVDGAFKATADKIDLLVDDTAVVANGVYIDAGKSVSANMKELDAGLNSVNTTVSDHTATLNKLDGDENTEGSVKKQIATALSGVSGNSGQLEDLTTTNKDSLVGAVNEVDSVAKDNKDDIQAIKNKTISYVADWENPTVNTKKISELN